MLLPSALPCDMTAASQRPQRPKLLSFGAFVPQQHDAYAGGLFVSCRALQSILGGVQSTQSQQSRVQSTATEILQPASPFVGRHSAPLQSPPRFVKPPRGLNKRRRDEFEEDQQNKENIPHATEDRDLYQTPKRQRRIPLDIPPGLKASDFASLTTPAAIRGWTGSATPRRERDESIEMPPFSGGDEDEHDQRNRDDRTYQTGHSSSPPSSYMTCRQSPQLRENRAKYRSTTAQSQPSPPPDPGVPQGSADQEPEEEEEVVQDQWSPLDDRRLVEVVLSKLNLSKRDWNDCAKELGKDKDSLGRRWKMLVGEGNVGLRRGLGRHERGDLDITSW